MIKLKNGFEIAYIQDFDQFFKNLLEAIIQESRKIVDQEITSEDTPEVKSEKLLREIMDNCIFVTHQLFELSKDNPDLSKFIVTGFLFNSLILVLPDVDVTGEKAKESGKDQIH